MLGQFLLYKTGFSVNQDASTSNDCLFTRLDDRSRPGKNKADIPHLANEKGLGQVKWVEETVSGRVSWRKREIANVIDELQTGDNLLVSELSRLGRSMLECMEILSVASQAGIHIYAFKGNWQLDDSIQSKIVAMAFGMAAEIERDLISQRTKEALTAEP